MATPNLVGRDSELALLERLVDQVSAQGESLLLLGDAGTGKSSLLSAAAEYGRDAGLRVLRTTGVEAEARLPFAGLHQLLRPLLGSLTELPHVQRDALLAALGASSADPPERFMIALAALNLITQAAASQPVLLIADDVQWLDQPTQDALSFVARRISADPVALIAAGRSDGNLPLTSAGLAELTISELDEPSARSLLTAHAHDLREADRQRILAEARGNPLALIELPAAIRAAVAAGQELPRSFLPLTTRLERTFAGRLAELDGPAMDTVLIAAMDSADDLQEVLVGAARLCGHPVSVSVLGPAVALGLVRLGDRQVRFCHPLVRSAVIASQTLARRQAAHLALAEVLADDPHRRVRHRAQALTAPDDKVADDLEASHVTSLRRGSATEAIWALERSAELTTDLSVRGRRLLLAAEHAFGLGRADLVDQLLGQAACLPLSRLERARMEWLREIFHDGVPGDPARVLELCDLAAQSLAADDPDLTLSLLLGSALRCWWSDTGPGARSRVVEVAASLDGLQDDPRCLAVLAVADPLRQGSRVIASLRAVVLEDVADPSSLWLLGMAAHAVGEPERAADSLARAESRLREDGRLGLLSQVLTLQVLNNVELGDWGRADSALQEGRRLALETGQSIWDIGTQTLIAIMAALHGDNAAAQAAAGEGELAADGRRLNDLLCCVQLARGIGLSTAGEHDAAYQELRRMFDPGDAAFHATERFHGVSFLADAALHAGRAAEARQIIGALESEARITTSATLHRHLGYARALLASDDAADELYQEVLSSDLVRWPWLRARTDLAYGSWLRRQRRPAESRKYLRSAQATLDLIGAVSWADQARAELRAAGERAASPAPTALSTLSAQELQIARLASQGLSNKEIGQRLYLSPRTVGSHLYRIFPKLGITSRVQLASHFDSA
jgi:DNA-binding CsgD family transcriptional regulator